MDADSRRLFNMFKQSYLTDYFKVVQRAKQYEKLQNRMCDYLYEELTGSSMYKRYLMMNMTDDIEIDIPDVLKNIGICSISFMEDGFEVLYDIHSLNKEPGLLYNTLSHFVNTIDVKNHNICNTFMLHGVDIPLSEFYYDTYLLLGSPHIEFNRHANVKLTSGPFLILNYSEMTSTWNYNFPYFYHLDTAKNTILVYIDSFSNFFGSVYGLHEKSSRILYYYTASDKMDVTSILIMLDDTNAPGPFNLLFGCNLKDLGLSKLEWLNMKSIVFKLAKRGINVRFLDNLAKSR